METSLPNQTRDTAIAATKRMLNDARRELHLLKTGAITTHRGEVDTTEEAKFRVATRIKELEQVLTALSEPQRT